MDKRKVDIAIIGAGTAGLTAYNAARKHTDNLVLIEGDTYGTTCARMGCMPSKLLIAAADSAHDAARAAMFGVAVEGIRINGEAVLERVRRERDAFVSSVLESMEAIPESHKLMGRARFLAPGRLAVGDALEVRAERIVIATGSSPHIPAMFQGLGDRLLTNDSLFELQTLPASIAVFGTGVVGLELGQALSRLGVHVRLLGRDGALGGIVDEEIRDYAERCFSEAFYLDTRSEVADLSPADNGVAITFTHQERGELAETFERILVATGRPPNLTALDLHHSGLTLDDAGIPVTDTATLQCGDSPVFLVGDANGQAAVLHEAAQEGRIAGDNAGRYPQVQAASRQVPLSVVFTHPQIASVGVPVGRMSGAKRKGFAVGTVSFEDQGRSKVIGKNRGLLKVYAQRGSGVFVGAEMLGPAAEHIGHLLAWAAQGRMTVREMLGMPFYHPVIEEGVRTALKDLNARLHESVACDDECLESGPGA
ncbi:dihydrolipoyl dehydrogenase [Chromatocurvus halotolerans]|uniref:Dihydrolipoamide dehydrogenase n=1 Tax=Chromatocurvus halotolerans TaxID=1132028 RepID=A0A4R2LGN0_9GAMM|nr:dihydrolipoyl dehydrogenase [Chromatocurvus halotolerans]TCO78475.1 dihydrolipoamide dehydrogenase [Chromatocurvus halotolerans]